MDEKGVKLCRYSNVLSNIFAYKFALAFLPKEDKKTTGLVPFKTGSLRYSLITPTERVNPAKLGKTQRGTG